MAGGIEVITIEAVANLSSHTAKVLYFQRYMQPIPYPIRSNPYPFFNILIFLRSHLGRCSIFLSEPSSVSNAHHPLYICLSIKPLQTDENMLFAPRSKHISHIVSRINKRIECSRCGGDDIGR